MVRAFVLLVGTALMLFPVLLNDGPFLYFDTASYLSRPDKAISLLIEALGGYRLSLFDSIGAFDGAGFADLSPEARPDYLVGGRSVFYGLAVWVAAAAGRPEVMTVVQAAAIVAVLRLVWDLLPEQGTSRRKEAGFLMTIGLLAWATPAGFFAGLLMPDVFAPLGILAVALLVCAWTMLGRATRLGLALLLAFSLAAHTSHLLVAICTIGTGTALRLAAPAARRCLSARGLACCLAAAGAAIAAGLTADIAAKELTGADTISRPHLTAHLVDDGPGALWVARNCPASVGAGAGGTEMAVCAFRDRIPTDWIAFLFSASSERGAFEARDASPLLRRALSEQDPAFAWAVLRDDPVGTTVFMAGAFLEQLVSVRYDDVPLSGRALRDRMEAFPAGLMRQGGGRIASDPILLSALSASAEITAAAGAVALLIGYVALLRDSGAAPGTGILLWIVAAVVLGVILNAAVCGMLASPYDRFQSRVIFLIPAFAVATWSALLWTSSFPPAIRLARSERVAE